MRCELQSRIFAANRKKTKSSKKPPEILGAFSYLEKRKNKVKNYSQTPEQKEFWLNAGNFSYARGLRDGMYGRTNFSVAFIRQFDDQIFQAETYLRGFLAGLVWYNYQD